MWRTGVTLNGIDRDVYGIITVENPNKVYESFQPTSQNCPNFIKKSFFIFAVLQGK